MAAPNFESDYHPVRQLESGVWIGCADFYSTCGLCVGLSLWGYAYRYCYEFRADAEAALREWDGTGDPPGPWVKLKGHLERGECIGPGVVDPKPWDLYELLDRGVAIRCKRCGLVSYNTNDVAQRYCGQCNVFHEDRSDAS